MNEKHVFLGVAVISVLLLPGCIFDQQKVAKISPTSVSELRTDEDTGADAKMVYFMQDFTNGHKVKVFQSSVDKEDTVLLNTNYLLDIVDVFESENKVLASVAKNDNNKSELREISLKTGEQKTLVELEVGNIGGAKFSPDGQKIAYMTSSNDEKTAELFIYDVKTKKSSKLSYSFDLPILSTPRPITWVGDNVIIKLTGGDAGGVWGETYRVNISTGKKEKITIPVVGVVSPDGSKFLSIVCSDGPSVEMEWPRSCNSGEEIQVTDIVKGTTQTLYKNLTHGDNTMKGLVRTIFAYDWTKEGNVVFRIADGFYEIDVKDKKLTEIRPFYWTDPQTVGKSVVKILFADKEYLAWSQSDDSFSAAFILNRDTGKATMLSNVDNNQTVISKMEKIR